ncbi:hypothetical protein BC831DRAFT_39177 [Entophlyctis helioformis]|nr:hypothetical protein BC831DRAFT_39177 [Entophlyctis helioformis]
MDDSSQPSRRGPQHTSDDDPPGHDQDATRAINDTDAALDMLRENQQAATTDPRPAPVHAAGDDGGGTLLHRSHLASQAQIVAQQEPPPSRPPRPPSSSWQPRPIGYPDAGHANEQSAPLRQPLGHQSRRRAASWAALSSVANMAPSAQNAAASLLLIHAMPSNPSPPDITHAQQTPPGGLAVGLSEATASAAPVKRAASASPPPTIKADPALQRLSSMQRPAPLHEPTVSSATTMASPAVAQAASHIALVAGPGEPRSTPPSPAQPAQPARQPAVALTEGSVSSASVSSASTASETTARSRPAIKRQRRSIAISACDECFHRKIRCDGQTPRCSTCVAAQRDCTYKRKSIAVASVSAAPASLPAAAPSLPLWMSPTSHTGLAAGGTDAAPLAIPSAPSNLAPPATSPAPRTATAAAPPAASTATAASASTLNDLASLEAKLKRLETLVRQRSADAQAQQGAALQPFVDRLLAAKYTDPIGILDRLTADMKQSTGFEIPAPASVSRPASTSSPPPPPPSLPSMHVQPGPVHLPAGHSAAPAHNVQPALGLIHRFFDHEHIRRPVVSQPDFLAALSLQPRILLLAMCARACATPDTQRAAEALASPTHGLPRAAPSAGITGSYGRMDRGTAATAAAAAEASDGSRHAEQHLHDRARLYYDAARQLVADCTESPSEMGIYALVLLAEHGLVHGFEQAHYHLSLAITMARQMSLFADPSPSTHSTTPSPTLALASATLAPSLLDALEQRRRLAWRLFEIDRLSSVLPTILPHSIRSDEMQIAFPTTEGGRRLLAVASRHDRPSASTLSANYVARDPQLASVSVPMLDALATPLNESHFAATVPLPARTHSASSHVPTASAASGIMSPLPPAMPLTLMASLPQATRSPIALGTSAFATPTPSGAALLPPSATATAIAAHESTGSGVEAAALLAWDSPSGTTTLDMSVFSQDIDLNMDLDLFGGYVPLARTSSTVSTTPTVETTSAPMSASPAGVSGSRASLPPYHHGDRPAHASTASPVPATSPMARMQRTPSISSRLDTTAHGTSIESFEIQLLLIASRVARYVRTVHLPDQASGADATVALLDLELRQWLHSLPRSLQTIHTVYTSDPLSVDPPSWRGAHLQLLYYFARLLLNLPDFRDIVQGSTANGHLLPAFTQSLTSAVLTANLLSRMDAIHPYLTSADLSTTSHLVYLSAWVLLQSLLVAPDGFVGRRETVVEWVHVHLRVLDSLSPFIPAASRLSDELRRLLDTVSGIGP